MSDLLVPDEQTHAAGFGDRLATVVDAELLDVPEVKLHGFGRNAECVGDLLVAQALVQQLQDLLLAIGEPETRLEPVLPGGKRILSPLINSQSYLPERGRPRNFYTTGVDFRRGASSGARKIG